MNKVEQLKELNQLKIDGVINQEEFESMKKEIVSSDSILPTEEDSDYYDALSEKNDVRLMELKEEMEEIENNKPSWFDRLCVGLADFMPTKSPEDESAESLHKMSYNPWFKRAANNFNNSKN